jgi:hypothetical protein
MCLALNPALQHPGEAKRRRHMSTAWDGTVIEWEPSHHRSFVKVCFYCSFQFLLNIMLFFIEDSDDF